MIGNIKFSMSYIPRSSDLRPFSFGKDEDSKLKIKNGDTFGVRLIDIGKRLATKFRCKTPSGTKALAYPENKLKLYRHLSNTVEEYEKTYVLASLSDCYDSNGNFECTGEENWGNSGFNVMLSNIPTEHPIWMVDKIQLYTDAYVSGYGHQENEWEMSLLGPAYFSFSSASNPEDPAVFIQSLNPSPLFPSRVQVKNFITSEGEQAKKHLICSRKYRWSRTEESGEEFSDYVEGLMYAEITARRAMEPPNIGHTNDLGYNGAVANTLFYIRFDSRFLSTKLWKDLLSFESELEWKLLQNSDQSVIISGYSAPEVFQYGEDGWNTSESGWVKIGGTDFLYFLSTYVNNGYTAANTTLKSRVRFRGKRIKESGIEYSNWSSWKEYGGAW